MNAVASAYGAMKPSRSPWFQFAVVAWSIAISSASAELETCADAGADRPSHGVTAIAARTDRREQLGISHTSRGGYHPRDASAMHHFGYAIRFILWLLTHTIYRIRVIAPEQVPSHGPALLVCNHMSHVDGLIVGASVKRFTRFLVYQPYFKMPLLNVALRLMKAIPAGGGTPEQARDAIQQAREALASGDVVCIFAEGGISRTGNLMPFKRGLEHIVEGLDVPVIPVFLDRLWGSVFSFKQGRFFWKVPERIPYPVTVAFGPPLPIPRAHGTSRAGRQFSSSGRWRCASGSPMTTACTRGSCARRSGIEERCAWPTPPDNSSRSARR